MRNFLLLAGLVFAVNSHAAVIGVGTFQAIAIFPVPGTINSVFDRFEICSEMVGCAEVFAKTYTVADVGAMFLINAGNSSEFGTVASLLTNGVNDLFGFENELAPTPVFSGAFLTTDERTAFFGGQGGPDFAGHTIADLRLFVTAVSFTPRSVAGVLGTETDLSFTVLVDEAAVPEPGAVALVGVSLAVGLIVRRRRIRLF
jgi:hypothetical protein